MTLWYKFWKKFDKIWKKNWYKFDKNFLIWIISKLLVWSKLGTQHDLKHLKQVLFDFRSRESLKKICKALKINFWSLKIKANQARKCKRAIIWYNLPYSMNVKTNIGMTFFKLLQKHFPPTHPMYTIFNKNKMKISYSCFRNKGSIIS